MRVPSIFYTTSVRRKSVYKIYRKTENGWKVLDNIKKNEIPKPATINHNQIQQQENNTQSNDLSTEQLECRANEMRIQMLSKSLYDQIFKSNQKKTPDQQTIHK